MIAQQGTNCDGSAQKFVPSGTKPSRTQPVKWCLQVRLTRYLRNERTGFSTAGSASWRPAYGVWPCELFSLPRRSCRATNKSWLAISGRLRGDCRRCLALVSHSPTCVTLTLPNRAKVENDERTFASRYEYCRKEQPFEVNQFGAGKEGATRAGNPFCTERSLIVHVCVAFVLLCKETLVERGVARTALSHDT